MKYTCVSFGEVLFDVLPNERKIGGAPLNIAYHLNKLDIPTTLITRVGNDENGEILKAFMSDKKLGNENVQTDYHHETSLVLAIANERGEMTYTIKEDVAWDYIEMQSKYESLLSEAKYFIFGSLSARSEMTRRTLFDLLEIPVKKVFDINLRIPFINKERIAHQLSKTNVLKMNADELEILGEWYGQASTSEGTMRKLQDKFHLDSMVVTCGAKGSLLLQDDVIYHNKGLKVQVADTIGSGDSFLAGFLSQKLKGATPQKCIDFAGTVGAFIATKTGGCPEYKVPEINQLHKALMTETNKI